MSRTIYVLVVALVVALVLLAVFLIAPRPEILIGVAILLVLCYLLSTGKPVFMRIIGRSHSGTVASQARHDANIAVKSPKYINLTGFKNFDSESGSDEGGHPGNAAIRE